MKSWRCACQDGSIWLSLRALCENFGLARAMQVQRIKRNDVLASDLIEVRVETGGGAQTIQVLRLESVPYWVSTIQIRRVREDLREKLLQYKHWVVQKVYEAFIREGSALLAPEPVAPPSATIQSSSESRSGAGHDEYGRSAHRVGAAPAAFGAADR